MVGAPAATAVRPTALASPTTSRTPSAADDDVLPTQPVGWIDGHFSVSGDGSARYDLPLWTPQGRGGFGPTLGLGYDSNAGDGPLGVGWSLHGLSTITPCSPTLALDGRRDAVHFASDDPLCLDGERLIPVAQDGLRSEFRVERDAATRVVAERGPDGVPVEFVARSRSGETVVFGDRIDPSRATAFVRRLGAGPDPVRPSLTPVGGRPVATAWHQRRTVDRSGNTVDVEYESLDPTGDGTSVELRPRALRYAPGREVRFTYEPRPDPSEHFLAGARTTLTGRLQAVTVSAPDPSGVVGALREYRLEYGNDTSTRRSVLRVVRTCDGAGVCLAPLRFDWSTGSTAFETIDTGILDAGTHVASANRIVVADVDGDGRDDIVYPDDRNRLVLRTSTGAGFGPAVITSVPAVSDVYQASIRPVDVNGDNRTDLLVEAPGPGPIPVKQRLYVSTGTDFTAIADPDPVASFTPGLLPVHLADLDGNGAPDLLTTRGGGPANPATWSYALNSGARPDPGFAPTVDTALQRGAPARVRVADTDGNGRPELIGRDRAFAPMRSGLDVAGNPETRPVNLWPSAENPDGFLVDVTGDGLPEALYPFHALGAQVDSGNGFGALLPGPGDFADPFDPGDAQWDHGIRFTDVDGDGIDDVVVLRPGVPTDANDPAHGVQVHRWRAGRFERIPLALPAGDAGPRGGWGSTQLLDVDGDRMTDMVRVDQGRLTLLKRTGQRPDLVTGVSVGRALPRVGIEYSTLADRRVHEPGTCSYPLTCPVRGGTVVAAHGVWNGRDPTTADGWNRHVHRYTGARSDLRGRGWLGFERHIEVDERRNAVVETEYDNSTREVGATTIIPYAGLVRRRTTTVRVDAGTEYRHVSESGYSVRRTSPGGSYRVQTDRRTDAEFERAPGDPAWGAPLHATTTETQYDDLGNVLVSSSSVDGGTSTRTENTWDGDVATWTIGLPRTSMTTACLRGRCETRSVGYDHDDLGRPTRVVLEPDIPRYTLATTVGYTPAGNVGEVRTGRDRAETRTYDADDLTLESSRNALGQLTRYRYHGGLGVLLSSTDPQGRTTTSRYDGFARPRGSSDDDGGGATVDYGIGDTGTPRVQTVGTDGQARTVDLDGLGRLADTAERAFDGRWARTRRTHDALGRLWTVTRPSFPGEPDLVATYGYDGLDRRTLDRAADGATTRIEHRRLETHTYGPGGGHQVETADADGRRESTGEDLPGGGSVTARFAYAPFGELAETINPDGTRRTVEYDPRGRPERETDPNTGVTTMGYGEYDEVTEQRNARGDVIRHVLDALGRTRETRTRDGVSTVEWDTAPGGIGKVARATSADGVTTRYGYDGLGRPQSTTVEVDGASDTVRVGYDAVGRLDTVSYPHAAGTDGLTVRYRYTESGQLASAEDAATGAAYWRAEETNAAGQIVSETLGNGLRTRSRYRPENGVLTRSTVAGPAGPPALDVSYGHDAARRISERIDAVAGTTDRYTHDTLGRLTSWRHEAPVAPARSRLYAYGDGGNLVGEDDGDPATPTRSYRYGEDGQPPGVLTSAGDDRFSSDALGRRESAPRRSIAYNAWDLPRRIVDRGRATDLAYDSYGERVLRADAETDARTVTVAGLYERRTEGTALEQRFRVLAGDRTVAEVVRRGEVAAPERYRVRPGDALWRIAARRLPPSERTRPAIDRYWRAVYARNRAVIGPDPNRLRAGTELTIPPPDGHAPVATITGQAVEYPLRDVQGSVVARSDAAGAVTDRLFYAPFGEPTTAAGDARAPGEARTVLGYAGQVRDDDTGLVRAGHRVYDPATRRFLTPDPVRRTQDGVQAANPYSYVENDPATSTDPTGFWPDDPDAGEDPDDPPAFSRAENASIPVVDSVSGGTRTPAIAAPKADDDARTAPDAGQGRRPSSDTSDINGTPDPVGPETAVVEPTPPQPPDPPEPEVTDDRSEWDLFVEALPLVSSMGSREVRAAAVAAVIERQGAPPEMAAQLADGWLQRICTYCKFLGGVAGGAALSRVVLPSSAYPYVTLRGLPARPSTPDLSTAAARIQNVVKGDPIAHTMRVTAVIQARTPSGQVVYVVGSSTGRLSAAQQALAVRIFNGNVRFAAGTGHAEVQALGEAAAQGYTAGAVGASKAVCTECATTLGNTPIRLDTPVKWPH